MEDIKKAPGGLQYLLNVLAVVGIVLILAAVFFPLLAQSKGSRRTPCLTNLKVVGTALLVYESDFGRLTAAHWFDRIEEQEKITLPTCPQAEVAGTGFALNGWLRPGKLLDTLPNNTPLVFETGSVVRNAVRLKADPVSRHPTFQSVVFADGHGKRIRPQDFAKLDLAPPK